MTGLFPFELDPMLAILVAAPLSPAAGALGGAIAGWCCEPLS